MAGVLRVLVLATVLLLAPLAPAAADKRVALVIGNGAYEKASMRLGNPPRDAKLITATLRELGFEVEQVTDANKNGMEDAVARLADRGRDADVVLFYYAGHALQDLGKNYLMPIDGALKTETDLRRRFVRLDDVLADLSNTAAARILVLDACRDNEAVEALRTALPKVRSAGVSRGLAPVPRISGMLVAFATQPDRVAADGTGLNSPFATAFAARVAEPGIELRTALTRVRADVASATDSQQVPEVSDSLIGELYLKPLTLGATTPAAVVTPPAKLDLAAETAFWTSAERMNTPAAFQAYLDRFGADGMFAALARSRLAAPQAEPPLERPAPRVESPPQRKPPSGPLAALSLAPDVSTDAPVLGDADADVAACDRLAASPYDPMRPAGVAGVEFEDIQPGAAVSACTRAVEQRPDTPRLLGQLGRAYDAAKDYSAARRWYEKGAALGHGGAMNNLGNVYERGSGVPRDLAQARSWYERADAAGHPNGTTSLGRFYQHGIGVSQDNAEAARLYKKAASAGDPGAAFALGFLYQLANNAEAKTWYERAAARGSIKAMYNLGVLYAQGEGVKQDFAVARRWYEKAAEKKMADAIYELGLLHELGRGGPKNVKRACDLYRQAAALGSDITSRKKICTASR